MSAPPVTWLPPPQQVANLLRARTKDDNSEELGAWTAQTRPTEHEVQGLIQTAAGDLLAAVDTLDPEWPDPDDQAQALCALRAAMLVELSYFPEQVQTGQSAYDRYKALWDDGVAALINALAGPPGGGSSYSVIATPLALAGGEHLWPWWVLNLPEPETLEPIVTVPPDPPGGKVVIGGSPPGDW